MNECKILLASASPRRRELLKLIFDDFECISVDADESLPEGIEPRDAVEVLACRKAKAARALACAEGKMIIAADTLVALGSEIFGKPGCEEDAINILNRLSGKTHSVFTGVCVITESGQSLSFCEQTGVEFFPLSEKQIARYVATGEPMDKAGAYGIQGKGALLVKAIAGDFYNVVGLPVSRLSRVIDMLSS